MSVTNIPTSEAIQPTPHFTAEIQSRSGHAIYDATLGALLGFDGAFFGSYIPTKEIPTSLMYGGAGATAFAIVAGAVSCFRHR